MKCGSRSLCSASRLSRLAASIPVLGTSYPPPDNLCCTCRQRLCALNPSAFAVVIPASDLFHNSVLVAAPSVSCLPALVTVSRVLEMMTLLVVMLALTRAGDGLIQVQ